MLNEELEEGPNFFRIEDAVNRLSLHCDGEKYKNDGKLAIVDDLRHFLETKLNVGILERNICELEYFLCSTYIAEFLSHSKVILDPNWYPVDQQLAIAEKKGGPYLYEDGGKRCFIIAAFFPGIHPKTGLSAKHYIDMSAGFFYHFYSVSGLEIGNHMAELCEEMVDITKEAIRS
jgi:hypothetical protein